MSLARTAPLRMKAPYREVVGASAAAGSNVSCHGVIIKARCPGQTIYVGSDNTLTTANGFPLADGDSLDLQVKNAADIWYIASAAAQGVAVLPYSLY